MLEKLLEIFESEQFEQAAQEYYDRKERFLKDDCKDENIFIPYLKAALLDDFMKADEKNKKEC